jgi:hypothetical protein
MVQEAVMTIQIIRQGVVKKTRRDHRCYDCGHVISAGSSCWSETLRYDSVYTLWYHEDCRRASEHFCRTADWHDFGEGVPPLREMIWDGGDQVELDALRGYFPHVVTRIEFWMQERP